MRHPSATIPSTPPALATRAARGPSSNAPEQRCTRTSSAPRSCSAVRAPARSCSTNSPFHRAAQRAKRSPFALRVGSGVGECVDMLLGLGPFRRLLLLLADQREEMSHLVALHLQVVGVVLRVARLDGNPLYHLQVVELLEAVDLLRV